MKENENALLRFGSFCILIGGIAANLLSIFGGVTAMLAMSAMDENTLYSLSNYMMQGSADIFDGGDAVAVARAAVIIVVAFSAVGMIIDIIVGAMGVSRSKNTQKYKFFLGWGIVLLIAGLFSMGQMFSLRGLFATLSGIVGPAMYIIGGIQQNKAANADVSGDS